MGKIYDGIMGLAVGDALGVPFEFKERDTFHCNGMTGFGTHNQPAGTWSDDTSLTLATLASLTENKGQINMRDMMNRFCDWRYNLYTAYGKAFDVGVTTQQAIDYYLDNSPSGSCDCGAKSITSNGNGSLMRILPLAFTMIAFTMASDRDIFRVSSLTHSHYISKLACTLYVRIAQSIILGNSKRGAVMNTLSTYESSLTGEFMRLPKIGYLKRNDIKSTGYVIDTLEAALWCFLTTDNYKDCVLQAVNLGDDTDTTAAVAGGLAGLYYGTDTEKSIPADWIDQIARKDYIKALCGQAETVLEYGGKDL